jgi:hypothetical protein
MLVGEPALTPKHQDLMLNFVVAAIGLVDAWKAVDLSLIIELADCDGTVFLGIVDQELGPLFQFGPSGASKSFCAAR